MNTIDAEVIEILSEPYVEWGRWWVKVKANDMGGDTTDTLMFSSKEEALQPQIGHTFLH